MKLFKWTIAALVSFALASCGGQKEENGTNNGSGGGNSEITLGSPSPSSALEEDVIGHNKIFTVACSGTLDAKMQDGSWATVKNVQKINGTTTWNVTVEIAFNSTDEVREDKLILSAGSKKAEATIRQKPISSLLGSTTEIVLEGMEPSSITLNFPIDWEISLTDTKAVNDWLSISPASGTANSAVKVVFTPKSLNLTVQDRKAFGKIDLGGGTLYLDISQASFLPSEEFIAEDAPYGLYNIYEDGGGIVYDELAHQLNWLVSSSMRNFRIVDPAGKAYIEFAGLPGSFAEGETASFTFNNFWDKTLGAGFQVKAHVSKVSDDRVWLVDDNKRGYIIAQ